MRYVDVFNGDADGLCALHQLRLAEPLPADAQTELVTGTICLPHSRNLPRRRHCA